MRRKNRRGKLQHLAAVPLTIEVDGKQYRISPLTLAQYAELEAWAREQPFKEIDGKLAVVKDGKVREALASRLIEDAVKKSERPELLQEYMNSSAAICMAFRLMIRTHHPKITDAEVEQIMSFKGMNAIREAVEELVSVEGQEGKNPQGEGG